MVVEEKDVGIDCYATACVTHADGFTGVMRHRFTDFRVNEIGLDGQEARITTHKVPAPIFTPPEEVRYESVSDVCRAYGEIYPENGDDAERLRVFLEAAGGDRGGGGDGDGDGGRDRVGPLEVTLAVCSDKGKRTRVHGLFKNCPFLGVRLDSKSGGSDGDHKVVVSVGSGRGKNGDGKGANNKRKRDDRNQRWSGGKTKYVRFVMEKVNVDTNNAISSVASMLRMDQKLFGRGGLKDKRAVTAQFVTVPHVEPERLVQLRKGLTKMLVRLGNFEYAKDQITSGDLKGNRFEIVLRGVTMPATLGGDANGASGGAEANADMVRKAVERTRANGFINYYGLQRFGTGVVPTHVTGEHLLRGQWKEAVDSVLTPTIAPKEDVRRALEGYLEDRDAAKAWKLLKRARGVNNELAVLEHLSKSKETAEDYAGAMDALNTQAKRFYVQAYYSMVWNSVVSERIRRHGASTVLVGDLVIRRDEVKRESAMGKRKRQDREMQEQRERDRGGECEDRPDRVGGEDRRKGQASSVSRLGDPHVVSEEDLEEGRYTIDDVVLPLPGKSVLYPENETKALYDEYNARAASDHTVKSFMATSFPGDYRYMIYRPEDLVCKLYRYKTDDEELPSFEDIEDTQDGEGEGEGKLALVLKFSLPPSSYATMCIREITRMPTDVGFAKSQKV